MSQVSGHQGSPLLLSSAKNEKEWEKGRHRPAKEPLRDRRERRAGCLFLSSQVVYCQLLSGTAHPLHPH